ncbi:hypothetical protein BASA50_006855 [Batrachochytrium salamandrivorans]|uniref:Uncharacterized protein n=1 Tax=Batrachochytrium salamandrivorans TaxID=1357716 RepID=A0ABQ8F8S5_9FUNG|nr:hypothetical protein BASA62_008100 [Batrachochytrium salamandrivorans]KAH6572773.1 hypothetical protein BASA60_006448 [Batrachochytrium salamandrivorans]KAH6594158.1 hypothetical protein BASA50_006855 [Batrachochytrium salamandrivorans]KAH6601680.1 hypothetical protein BASA61_001884 [Batrachochytrium salamandrivorans]KAH9273094.1 hypothetical protein BASA83_004671 [Batrachochytrium salamandrivorans]
MIAASARRAPAGAKRRSAASASRTAFMSHFTAASGLFASASANFSAHNPSASAGPHNGSGSVPLLHPMAISSRMTLTTSSTSQIPSILADAIRSKSLRQCLATYIMLDDDN